MNEIVESAKDCRVEQLGDLLHPNPLRLGDRFFFSMKERVLVSACMPSDTETIVPSDVPSFERPGPFKSIFFKPSEINVGIVTCGGLCPGLNDVIRSITYCCLESYRVKNVFGFRHGYFGLTSEGARNAVSLTPSAIHNIHEQGGSILGTSRGPQSVEDMVDTLVRFNISVLFTIGGDGTQRGAMGLTEEIRRRGLRIAVMGVPKTIDNDISFIHKTFGFDTAVEEARKAINAAHVEARGSHNGIGLVKLMGRHAGFIAAHATLASGNANICLIPEEPLEIPSLFLRIRKRLERSDHMVVVVAEGVGQDLMKDEKSRRFDDSGNVRLKDIGPFLRKKIADFLTREKIPFSIKYIDPSYMIRSTATNAVDSSFCLQLGNHAVHAAMAGRTNALVGYWNQHFCLIPIHLALRSKKCVDINGEMWRSVLEITT